MSGSSGAATLAAAKAQPLQSMDEPALAAKARWLRLQTLEMIGSAGKGHIGGSYSCMELLVALYYGGILRFDPARPDWPGRDRLVLSKGHGTLGIYPLLADLGYFSLNELGQFTRSGGRLGGHPDNHIPGIETVTGSLGHGLSVGAGMALASKLDEDEQLTVVLLGDGECHEGTVWEAALFASWHRLRRLVAIVDRNRIGGTDFLERSMELNPFEDKWKAFGWDVVTIDGHAFADIFGVLRGLRRRASERPLVIVANTTKGRGVSFMENVPKWHHGVPKGEQLERARQELS